MTGLELETLFGDEFAGPYGTNAPLYQEDYEAFDLREISLDQINQGDFDAENSNAEEPSGEPSAQGEP